MGVIKSKLKKYLLHVYQSFMRYFECIKLRKIKFDKTVNQVKIFTGFQDKNSGGGLKLKDLKIYDSAERRYNILYLVSSSLPFSYLEMIAKAKKSDIKIIWNQNGIGFPAWAGQDVERINKVMKDGLVNADFVIFQSKFAEISVNKLIVSTTEIKSKIVYNAIDTSLFVKKAHPSFRLRILVAGSHNDIERVTVAISTFEILRDRGFDCELVIAGKIKEKYKLIITGILLEKSLSDFVLMTGPYGRRDGAEIFSASDILLHIQPFDNCPTVVVEAMASGLIVVGPNNGGVRELVGPELNTCLVDNKTTYDRYDWGLPEKYADKIIDILPDLIYLQEVSRKRAKEKFDLSSWLSSHEEIFCELKESFTN